MRDAFPLPPNSHGLERTGLYCQCCGREIVLSVQGVFAYAPRGSSRRFCDPACRQAAYRRRIASVEENTPPQRQGGRERQLNPSPPAGGAKSDRHPGAKSG
jgi:hypothetical protein